MLFKLFNTASIRLIYVYHDPPPHTLHPQPNGKKDMPVLPGFDELCSREFWGHYKSLFVFNISKGCKFLNGSTPPIFFLLTTPGRCASQFEYLWSNGI